MFVVDTYLNLNIVYYFTVRKRGSILEKGSWKKYGLKAKGKKRAKEKVQRQIEAYKLACEIKAQVKGTNVTVLRKDNSKLCVYG